MNDSLKWVAQVIRELLLASWSNVLFIVVLTLLSKASSTLALFLPIKIILLIGQSNLPSYLPEVISGYEKNTVIFMLCIASVGFYATHVIFEMLIEYLESKGVISVLARMPDIKLSSAASNLIKKTYRRTSKSLAELTFFITIIIFLAFLYVDLLLVICIYAVMLVTFFSVRQRINAQKQPDLLSTNNRGEEEPRSKVMFDIGFLLAFVYIVYDLVSQPDPAIYIAFISFLLLRQSSNGLKRVVQDYIFLNSKKPKLETLILGSQNERPAQKPVNGLFLSKMQLIDLVVNSTQRKTDEIHNKFEVSWCELSGNRDVQAFIVKEVGNEKGSSFLLKLYKHDKLAYRESSLLEIMPKLPALNFIVAGRFSEFTWHVYEYMAFSEDISPLDIIAFREDVMTLDPTKRLVDEWQHSRLFIWQRMDEHYWQSLFQFAELIEPELSKQVEIIRHNHKVVCHILEKLPLVLVNQETGKISLRKLKATNNVISLSWERWSIEPIGAGLSVGVQDMVELESTIKKLKEKRPAVSLVDNNAVKLSAMFYSLESLVGKQKFKEAFELLPNIIKLINNLPEVGVKKNG